MLLIRNFYRHYFHMKMNESEKASRHAFHWVGGIVYTSKGQSLLDPKLKVGNLVDVGIWED